MPDDNLAAAMVARGAKPVTIRARMNDSERLQRHAAWRLPMEHKDSLLIDSLYAEDKLTPRQYANACACLSLYMAAGLARSRGVASYLREGRGTASGEGWGPEDEWRALIRDGGYPMQVLAVMLRSEALAPGQREIAAGFLDTLDAVAARWEGERWRDE